MLFIIGNKNLSVAVESFGAQLNSVKYKGNEKIWQNEDGSWDGHAPLMFPYCGRLTLKVNGACFPNVLHGFAKSKEFIAVKQTESELWLNLSYDNKTLETYPFKFSLTIKYSVNRSELTIETVVENLDEKVLYFSTGGHESYSIDEDLENYYVEFEKEEKFLRLDHNEQGVLTGHQAYYPASRYLKFAEMPILNDKTLIFKDINSSWCKLIRNDGKIVAKTFFKGFKNILFWKTDSGRFLCIEPWLNLPDTVNVEPKEISKTQGFVSIPIGESRSITRKIVYY